MFTFRSLSLALFSLSSFSAVASASPASYANLKATLANSVSILAYSQDDSGYECALSIQDTENGFVLKVGTSATPDITLDVRTTSLIRESSRSEPNGSSAKTYRISAEGRVSGTVTIASVPDAFDSLSLTVRGKKIVCGLYY